MTCIPMASASTLSWLPIWPYPMMPIIERGYIQLGLEKVLPKVFPRTSQHLLLTLFQSPSLISCVLSTYCRLNAMISLMTSSATLRELLNGLLNTAIPRFAAYSKSTWLVPMQKHPMQTKFEACLSTFAVNLVLERMPMHWTSLIFSINWSSGREVLWNSIWKSIKLNISKKINSKTYLISFFFEDFNSSSSHILKKHWEIRGAARGWKLHIFISALANGLRCLRATSVPDLVGRRECLGILNWSGGLVLYDDGLDDMRANVKSKEEETGGEEAVEEGERAILATPPVMGMFPDILRVWWCPRRFMTVEIVFRDNSPALTQTLIALCTFIAIEYFQTSTGERRTAMHRSVNARWIPSVYWKGRSAWSPLPKSFDWSTFTRRNNYHSHEHQKQVRRFS